MSSEETLPSLGGNTVVPAQQDQRRQLRLALLALVLPAFFVIGYALCYVSAFQAPAPHGVPVAVAGPTVRSRPSRSGAVCDVGPAFDVQAIK